jgi:hypothetical protein
MLKNFECEVSGATCIMRQHAIDDTLSRATAINTTLVLVMTSLWQQCFME